MGEANRIILQHHQWWIYSQLSKCDSWLWNCFLHEYNLVSKWSYGSLQNAVPLWLVTFSDICVSGMLAHHAKTALGLCFIWCYANFLLFFFPWVASLKTKILITTIRLKQQNCGPSRSWALKSVSTVNLHPSPLLILVKVQVMLFLMKLYCP